MQISKNKLQYQNIRSRSNILSATIIRSMQIEVVRTDIFNVNNSRECTMIVSEFSGSRVLEHLFHSRLTTEQFYDELTKFKMLNLKEMVKYINTTYDEYRVSKRQLCSSTWNIRLLHSFSIFF